MPGARNPKMARFSLNLTADIDRRIGVLADAAGMNKGTMAAMLIAAGLRQMEAIYLVQKEQHELLIRYAQESSEGQIADMRSVIPPGTIK